MRILFLIIGAIVLVVTVFLFKRLLKTAFRHLSEPLNSIKDQPYQFAVWFIVANVFGLAGFLLPILFCWTRSKDTHAVFISSIKAGTLASFSVVLLAEGIASALVAIGAGKNVVAAGIRGLISVLALLVAMIQVGLLVVQSLITDESIPSPIFQVCVTLAAILFASYLYCFRFGAWEKGVESIREEDDNAVTKLEIAAQGKTEDKGVKL